MALAKNIQKVDKKKSSMGHKPVPNVKIQKVTVSGDLNIQKVHSAKEKVLELITSQNKFGIQLNNVEGIDLAFVQFLLSVFKSTKENDLLQFIAMSLNDEHRILLERAGLLQLLMSYSQFKLSDNV